MPLTTLTSPDLEVGEQIQIQVVSGDGVVFLTVIGSGGGGGSGTVTDITATGPIVVTPPTPGQAAYNVALAVPVDVAEGGTGATSLTAHGVLVGEGTGPIVATAVGAIGEVLTSNGPGVDPSFGPGTPGPAGPAGTGTSIAATTNISATGLVPAFGATPNIIRETVDGSTGSQITRSLPPAGTVPNGSVYWLKTVNLRTAGPYIPVLVLPTGGAPIDDPNNPDALAVFTAVAVTSSGASLAWQFNNARAWELILNTQVPGIPL